MLNRFQIRMERNDDDVESEGIAPEQEPDDDEDVPMAEKDEEIPKTDDAMQEEVTSSRGEIADAIGFIYNASERVQVCLYCGSIEHDHEECQHENKAVIKNAFQLIRDTMFPNVTEEEKKDDEEDEVGEPASQDPQEGDDAPTEKGFDDEEEGEEDTETIPEHMYESPLFMSRVGDQDEYGSFCIDGFLLAQGGPTTDGEIMEIAKEAMMKGQPVTTMTIPFDRIRSAWVEDGRGNWHRLLVPSGSSQLIKSVRSPSRYATRDTIIWEARLCAKAFDEEDAEAAEILDIVVGLETRAIRSGTVEEKTNMQRLLTYVIDHKEPDRAGCTVCPACLLSTPVKLSMCLHCKGMMVSHGRKPFKMTKEEVEEAENTPFEGGEKADDDEMKDEEPSDEVKMETDEVNVDDQFEEV
eukprot:s1145_g13.t1